MLTMQTSKGVAAGLAMLGAVELLTTDSLAAQKFSDVEAGQPWTARELGLHGLVPGDFSQGPEPLFRVDQTGVRW